MPYTPNNIPEPEPRRCPFLKSRVRTNDAIAGVVYEFYEEPCFCLQKQCELWIEYADPRKSRCALHHIAESL